MTSFSLYSTIPTYRLRRNLLLGSTIPLKNNLASLPHPLARPFVNLRTNLNPTLRRRNVVNAKNAKPRTKNLATKQNSFPREAQTQKLKEAETIGRGRKLVLPTAQVGESELEEIVKSGIGGEEAKALVSATGANEASGRLLSDHELVGWRADSKDTQDCTSV